VEGPLSSCVIRDSRPSMFATFAARDDSSSESFCHRHTVYQSTNKSIIFFFSRMHNCTFISLKSTTVLCYYYYYYYYYYYHCFTAPWTLSGTTRVSRYQKGKTNLDLLEQKTVSGSGISWAIRKSVLRPQQITMPAPHHLVFYRPDALPATEPTASKH